MDTFGNTKSKVNFKNLLGGMGFFEDDNFERESERETSVVGIFPSTGSLEFNSTKKQEDQIQQIKKEQAETNRKEAFFQTLKEEQNKVQVEKDKVFEEELNDIVSNLPTEQKNRLLHYQASYKDKSVYQRAELRRKLIEEQQKAEKQEKEASIPSPAKQPSAMEGAFEGRSGNQGSGQANLSAQAVG
ncbi:hypothetical protein A3I48_01280 [Candidatus Daviesbacteria bacterium RIFCSPLOWO2_02_FULL_36_7]|uniref:Uncharacterized protein n=1 Tax=Candidatus Daviesbacteria bacterium RIFCSPLOWO2_02_FULL_36_7 TaxID=1797792 RepID=A0A1F5MHQ7_9BACT|nr:MAG: hypothetical protein A3I48_01280 [Candidatus Daviesbacteria bacterium RIFCSPLOWO2_02_FULL_36_7]